MEVIAGDLPGRALELMFDWTELHQQQLMENWKRAPDEILETATLPDPNDRHVLAAAIVARCDVIVTQNLNHFPDDALEPSESMRSIPANSSRTTFTSRRVCFATLCAAGRGCGGI